MPSETREAILARYADEYPLYDRLCKYVENQLQISVKELGVPARVESRAKEPDKLWKKILRRSGRKYEGVKDKAGARIVATFPSDIQSIRQHLTGLFPKVRPDDKSLALGTDRVGYLGIHWDIPFPNDSWELDLGLDMAFCEVQLQTQAQRLWSDLFHDIIYKPEDEALHVPTIERRALLLSGLCELIDLEFETIRSDMAAQGSTDELRVLQALIAEYRHFTSVPFDRELSVEVLRELVQMFESADAAIQAVRAFATEYESKLTELYSRLESLRSQYPMFFQPEAMLALERLEHAPTDLRAVWQQVLPYAELEDLSTLWGKPVPSPG